MKNEMYLDAIKADIQAIDLMLWKYQIDPEVIFENAPFNVKFPEYIRLEELMDDIEELHNKIYEISEGFGSFIVAARDEHERRKKAPGFTDHGW